MAEAPHLAFVGLGVMGRPMCANLAAGTGRPVLAFDQDPVALEAAVATDGVVAGSLAEIGRAADIVFLALPGEAEIRRVCLGPGGLVSAAPAGRIVVDCSTAPVALAVELAAIAESRGAEYVDCPIAGTWQSVESRDISLMAGATEPAFRRLGPYLRAMSDRVMHCGGAGAGSTVKLLLNMVVAQNVVTLAEALTVARQAGVDGAVLFEALARGADSFALRQHGMTALLPDSFPVGRFSSRYMLKDLDYLAAHAEGLGLGLEGLAQARRLLRASIRAGNAEAYWPALIHSLAPEAAPYTREVDGELIRLHHFFDDWFAGVLPDSDVAFEAFSAAMAPDLTFISAMGAVVPRDELLSGLRAAHGARAGQDYRVVIDNIRHGRAMGDVYPVIFDEWHQSPAGRTGRVTSALVRRAAAAPHGFLWQHVHETWLAGHAPEAG
ncbi:MAG: NAD(P)-binding domain-containing protein [Alphaproteobacteria bacterium]|jgi:hypothetical protein|nr:NAD(P)-binding domain-containing protein [Alphaproteobacteria bacterium]